jgi:cytochrome c-type biogenesis protein CcmH
MTAVSPTARIDALREALRALQARHAAGDLDAEALAAARAPLERELVDLVTAAAPAAAPAPTAAHAQAARPSRGLRAGLAAGIVALAVAGYALTGSPGLAGLGSAPPAAAAGDAPVTEAQVAEIVEKMAQRLKEEPGNGEGWALLARAYSALGRHAEAVPAFAKAIELLGESAPLLVDQADAVAAANGGQFTAQALELVRRALVLDPGNVKGLALAGSAAFDRREYATAVRLWEQVESALPPDAPILPQVRESIAQARQAAGLPPAGAAAPVAKAASAAGANFVAGRVTLSPELAARVQPDDTVFVLARPAEGPRMPVAVLRRQVRDLPLDFRLDDSVAMAGAKLSDHPRLVVVARISRSGQAAPQPGDLSGQSAPVAPGTRDIALRIDEVVGR